jgi:anti-sigma factor RsiW
VSDGKSCGECVELLLDYVEGQLPEDERSALDAHFAACPPCVEFLRSYRETPRIMRSAMAARMPEPVKDRLRKFLAQRKRGE